MQEPWQRHNDVNIPRWRDQDKIAKLTVMDIRQLRKAQAEHGRRLCADLDRALGVPGQWGSGSEIASQWQGDDWTASLCVEVLPDSNTDFKLRVTRIETSPVGRGIGTKMVQTLREYAAQRAMILEVPDPFPSSLGFWQNFDWETDLRDGRVLFRYVP